MVVFYKIWKKYNEIQLTKQMDLNNRKMTNHPPSSDSNNKSPTILYYENNICEIYFLAQTDSILFRFMSIQN